MSLFKKLFNREGKKHSVNLFGEKGLKEGMVDAVRKYGKMDITAEDIGFLSTSICQSCYLLVKGIDEKIRKFANICQESSLQNEKNLRILFCCYHQYTQEMEFKKFLMAVHALNVDELLKYNIAVIYNERMTGKREVMEEKSHYVQRAYWFDTREKKLQGTFVLKLLQWLPYDF